MGRTSQRVEHPRCGGTRQVGNAMERTVAWDLPVGRILVGFRDREKIDGAESFT